jgi:hypothetical protein
MPGGTSRNVPGRAAEVGQMMPMSRRTGPTSKGSAVHDMPGNVWKTSLQAVTTYSLLMTTLKVGLWRPSSTLGMVRTTLQDHHFLRSSTSKQLRRNAHTKQNSFQVSLSPTFTAGRVSTDTLELMFWHGDWREAGTLIREEATNPVLPRPRPSAVVVIQALDLKGRRRKGSGHGNLGLDIVIKPISCGDGRRRVGLHLGFDKGRETTTHFGLSVSGTGRETIHGSAKACPYMRTGMPQ